ncbi:MAG: flagellar basal body-associated FliL family protein [Lachnospiraceae bacterium]|nr:flagellar basal body-associated FliL family protein [Lachnospiraceae bacterium]
MKRNMLAIIILAVSVVNLAMSAFMMLTVMNTNSKTVKLIADVAAAVNIDNTTILPAEGGGVGAPVNVPMDKTVTYDIAGEDKMTIAFRPGDDGETHYGQVEVVLLMNSDSDGYKTFGGDMDSRKSVIKSKILEIMSGYTVDECRGNESVVQQQILEALQELFDSDFIFKVNFSSITYA